jgi:hypothetical protein
MAEAMQTGPANGGSTTEQAQEKARDVAGQAQEKVGEAAEQAKSTVRQQVDERSTKLGEQVGSQASDVRSVADELRKQGKDKPADLAEQAAERAEKVGKRLTESDGDRILHDVEDFGRSKPWAIALGGLALGFTVSRLLKASSNERYRSTAAQTPMTTRLPAGAGAGTPANGIGAQ